jgi:flagellum-specific peptidoglycan hydrolase FlgJ
MRFASLGGSNAASYAAAGKSVADSAAKIHAVQRKTGPDYGELSKVAMKTNAAEKIAAINASASVTTAGIKAYSDVTQTGQRVAVFNKKNEIANNRRKAGGIAAIGKIAAAGFLSASDNTKDRKYPTADRKGFDQAYQADVTKLLADNKSKRESIYSENDTTSEALRSKFKPSDQASTPANPDTADVSSVSEAKPGKVTTGAATSVPSDLQGDGSYDGTFGSVFKMAQASGARYPALVAAQWKLESAGGTAISGKNNFFGIKASGDEAGTSKNTWEENSAGQAYNTSARFKDFETPQGSVNELVSRWHKNYKNFSGVNNAGSRADAARMLSSEGYATDSKYADKLIRIMNENGYGN